MSNIHVPVPTLHKGDAPPASIPQPSIVEWKVVPLPPTPEDKILNDLHETIEVDWNGLPLEQALVELFEPINLDYRGYVTEGSEASEFESTVQLRHRATRKQILQRLLGPRDLGYIVRPSAMARFCSFAPRKIKQAGE